LVRLAVGSGQSRRAHRIGQSALDPGVPRAPAVLEEQEIDHAAVPLSAFGVNEATLILHPK